MKQFMPGLYRLKVDVKSPRPDGRATHRSDWRKHKVWKAGTEFIVRRAYGIECSIAPRNHSHWDLHAANPGNLEYDCLLECLERGELEAFTELTVASVVDRTDISSRQILEDFLSSGRVEFSMIQDTALRLRATEDKEQ